MRLTTAIQEAVPGIGCDVRITQKEAKKPGRFPGLPFDLFVVVVTREVAFEERHSVHEQIALEFWQDVADNALLSIQLVG